MKAPNYTNHDRSLKSKLRFSILSGNKRMLQVISKAENQTLNKKATFNHIKNELKKKGREMLFNQNHLQQL